MVAEPLDAPAAFGAAGVIAIGVIGGLIHYRRFLGLVSARGMRWLTFVFLAAVAGVGCPTAAPPAGSATFADEESATLKRMADEDLFAVSVLVARNEFRNAVVARPTPRWWSSTMPPPRTRSAPNASAAQMLIGVGRPGLARGLAMWTERKKF